MKYIKAEVIKKGERAIEVSKRNWLIVSIVAFVVAGLGTMAIFYTLIKDSKIDFSPFGTVFMVVSFIVFGILTLIIPRRRVPDPLLEGCKAIESEIKRKLNSFNRQTVKLAKKKSKSTNRRVQFSKYFSDFKYQELYQLLSNNDEVEYLDLPSDYKSLLDRKIKTTNRKTNNDHNFDSYFTDNEFDDLMD